MNKPFYDNCRNSRTLIGYFLLSISGQTHEFIINAYVKEQEWTIWQSVDCYHLVDSQLLWQCYGEIYDQ